MGKSICENFKTKQRRAATPDELMIFPDTHEAIIDQDTWDIARKIRSKKKPRVANGTYSHRLSGLVYCADCGARMGFISPEANHSEKHYDSDSAFQCGNYRSKSGECVSHYVKTSVLEAAILQAIQAVSKYVLENEDEFIQQLKAVWNEQQTRTANNGYQELAEAKKRMAELDEKINKLYESTLSGLLPERQAQRMIQQYDEEQILLERRVAELENLVQQDEIKQVDASRFIALVKKYRDCEELTDTIGLTVDRAQELGEKFCAEHFPGHQALVCTHPDGHSHTENIHVHIVINSLRIAEVPMLPHMDRPADRKAGCKHRCTDAAMNYLKAEVMEMCHSEGLYQIDLLNGSKERITEREYWAQKKGQAALDKANAPMIADGITPRQTKFETDKAKLRRTIREALAAASGFDEFAALLLRHGVTVKESRGRLSYLTPDRTKPITARKLGDDFDRAAVLSVLEQNAARAAEKPAAIAEYPGSIKDRLRTKKEAKNAPNNDAVQRMVDIAAKRAEGKGRGYEKWATMHNLKQMSATLMLYQQYGFSSPDELDAAISAANTATQESLAGLKGLEAAIREKKELQRNLLGYIGTKPARDGLKAQKSEKARRAYREQHESDFIIADTAARYFREHGITKLPASKALQREIEQLTVQKNAGYNDYREKRQRAQELQTVRRNIDQILRGAPSQQKKREQER